MENNLAGWLRAVRHWMFQVRIGLASWLLYAATIGFLVLNGCAVEGGRKTTPTPIPPPILPVKPVYEVQVGEITELVKFTGRIAPVTEVELAFGMNGRVDQVLVKSGDTVQTGDLLALLDTGSQKYELRRAEIALELAQIDLTLAHQQQAVAYQTNNLDQVKKERALELAQASLDILTKAGYTGSILQQATFEMELAQLELDLARQQSTLRALELETSLSVKERQIELAQIALQEIQDLVADSKIEAPFDGQIVSVYINEDTAAEANKTALILVDTTGLEIRANPSAAYLQLLQEGMPVSASPVGKPGNLMEGVVRSLPYPYGSGKVDEDEVRIELDPAFSLTEFKLGDLVQITVILAHKSDSLWLPPQAIRTFGGRKFVVIQEGEGQRRVDIEIGLQAEDRVEILEGLKLGQIVLSP